MPRYDYESIKKIIYEKSNGSCKLLSKEYINNKTPLLLQCKCGNKFERTFNKLQKSQFICKDCIHKNYSKNYSLKFEKVLDIIKNGGCEYISGEYKNNCSKLTLKCKCGNLFIKDINHFKRGQNHCLKCGKENLINSKLKYNIESAKKILETKGYTLLEKRYINCQTPMRCICKRGHITNVKLSPFLENRSGCKICANIELIGENHWNYKGGESEVIDTLRKSIKDWKKQVLKRDNYICCISNKNKNLEIHHIKSFMTIVEEACNELKLPLYRKIKDYDDKDFDNLLELFIKKHTLDIGITLNKEIHKQFHKLYGKTNNTKEQFEEFKSNYLNNN